MKKPYHHYILLKLWLNTRKTCEILVSGISMYPVISNGDYVVIQAKREYSVGAVIVFYNDSDDRIIVHRILQQHDGYYICKGDNTFRLEKVAFNRVIGEVLDLPIVDDEFIITSLKLGQAFIENEYNVLKTKNTALYKTYRKKYLMGINKKQEGK